MSEPQAQHPDRPASGDPADAAQAAGESGGKRKRRRRLRPMRPIKPIKAIPTILTLGNLVCGFSAIHYAMKPVGETQVFHLNSLTVAGLLIFIGMFFDAIDGSVARLTRSTSDLGAQLDSLADVVSFGVAPAFMMLRLVSHYYGPQDSQAILGPDADTIWAKIIWTIAVVYVCCAALRLARFNAETPSAKEEDHRHFKGLPSPGAGGTVASLIVLHQHLLYVKSGSAYIATGFEENIAFARAAALGIPLVTLLCAIAMVSSIRYSHFANRVLRSRRDFAGIVQIVVPLIACIYWLQFALAAGFTIYAVSGPLGLLWRREKQPVTTEKPTDAGS